MNIEEYVNSLSTEKHNEIIKESLSCIGDGLFHLFYNWRLSYDKKNVSEADAISQCILQIAVCKIRTLMSMCEGISLNPNELSTKVLDIPSMISVLRSLYELTFVFHNIYAEQDTKTERDIVLYLWKIRGLNNRQNLENVHPQYKAKEENEKKKIKELQGKIFALAKELKLPQDIISQLRNVVTSSSVDIKGYKFKKDKNSNVISFKSIRFNDGIEEFLDKSVAPIYRFLSIQGHPSYLGVLQFGQMFDKGEDIKFLKTILACASNLASTLAIDFRDNVTGAKCIFDALSEREKNIIEVCYDCKKKILDKGTSANASVTDGGV